MNPIDSRWLETAERVRTHCYPTMAAPRDTSMHLAQHEAAHAVVGVHIGWNVNGATIDAATASGGAVGAVWFDGQALSKCQSYPAAPVPLADAVYPDQKALLCCWAALYYAGRQAELLHAGIKVDGWYIMENAPDDQHARYQLSVAFGQLRGTTPMGGAQALARIMLREYWSEVEAIAAALLERRTLTGDEIREAMNRGCAAAGRSDPLSRRAPPDALRVEPFSIGATPAADDVAIPSTDAAGFRRATWGTLSRRLGAPAASPARYT